MRTMSALLFLISARLMKENYAQVASTAGFWSTEAANFPPSTQLSPLTLAAKTGTGTPKNVLSAQATGSSATESAPPSATSAKPTTTKADSVSPASKDTL
jgi:hypothetical protein